jgi:uncharacterized membrane protein
MKVMKWHIVNDFAIWYVELLINCFTSCFCFFVSFNVCYWMCSNGDVCTYVQCMCSKCVHMTMHVLKTLPLKLNQ